MSHLCPSSMRNLTAVVALVVALAGNVRPSAAQEPNAPTPVLSDPAFVRFRTDGTTATGRNPRD